MIHSNFFEQGRLCRLEFKSKSCKNPFRFKSKIICNQTYVWLFFRQKVKTQLEPICKSYAKRLLNFLCTLRDPSLWLFYFLFLLNHHTFSHDSTTRCLVANWTPLLLLMTDKFGAAMALVKSDIGGNITVSIFASYLLPYMSYAVWICRLIEYVLS